MSLAHQFDPIWTQPHMTKSQAKNRRRAAIVRAARRRAAANQATRPDATPAIRRRRSP